MVDRYNVFVLLIYHTGGIVHEGKTPYLCNCEN